MAARGLRSVLHNSVAMPYEVWESAFINDAPEDVRRLTHSTVEPLDPRALGVPASFVLGSDELALPPGEHGWLRFAERLGVSPVMTPGSHEACFTQPASLAQAFLEA